MKYLLLQKQQHFSHNQNLNFILIHFFYIQILVGGKNVLIFVVDKSSSVHIHHLSEGPPQGLDDTIMIMVEAKYSINFSRSHRKFCLIVHLMKTTVFCFLIPQKYSSSKEKTLK